MKRVYIVLAAMAATVLVANAGQIQIGQYAGNVSTGASSGLTAAYVNGTASCVGAVFQGNTCIASSTPTWVERNYDTTLFASSNLSAGGTPTAYTGYTQSTNPAAGNTLPDATNQETFAMLSDTSLFGGSSENVWLGKNGAASTITIPVGVFGVTDVWTMLDNLWGQSTSDTLVTFNFGGTSNATTNLTSVAVALNNATNSGGQLRSSVDCTASTSGTSGYPACASYPGGPLTPSATLTDAVSVNGGASTPGTINVLTNTLYSAAYSGGQTAASAYFNTSGTLNLDDQGFLFGASYASQYLVSIQVTEMNGVAKTSDTALSAITIDTVPEPSTSLLIVAGIFLTGILARRTRQNSGTQLS